jgi:gliding motility-associated lipoprotein GldH
MYLCGMKTGFWLLLTSLLAGCSAPTLVDREISIPAYGWTWADSLEWTFEVADTLAIYHLELDIRHDKNYRHQNCYVQFHTVFPEGERISQVVSLELQSGAGRWLGTCRGELCRITIPIQENAFFNQMGAHAIRLEQYMRQDSLQGLEAFHLRIVDTGKRRSL